MATYNSLARVIVDKLNEGLPVNVVAQEVGSTPEYVRTVRRRHVEGKKAWAKTSESKPTTAKSRGGEDTPNTSPSPKLNLSVDMATDAVEAEYTCEDGYLLLSAKDGATLRKVMGKLQVVLDMMGGE